MVSHWSLSDTKSPQVSSTIISILADLDNAIVWLVSTRPLISKFSSPFINPLVTVPRATFTNGITVTFMFHCFSVSLQVPGTYSSFRFLTILFCGQAREESPQFGESFFSWSGPLAEIRGSFYEIRRGVSFSMTVFWVVHIPFVR